jgi:signal transduction histidine kinase
MIAATTPNDEAKRLQDVFKTRLLDTPEEKEFNEIVQLASDICDTPISLISLLDTDRQWFKARVGLDVTETPRDVSFCAHAILQNDLFEIKDTLNDQRFNDNPLVIGDPQIRFYAGVPLVTDSGSRLGTLCVIDRHPRSLTEKQKFALTVLAGNVIKIAQLRVKNMQLYRLNQAQKLIISIVAHDVRNPLTAIQSVISLKDEDIIDEQTTSHMLKLVGTQLEGTIHMVDDLVGWGKMQLSNQASGTVQIDLNKIVEDVITNDALSARIKNDELINAVPPGLTVDIDIQIIKFILRNLVSNAIKFTENGSITISALANNKTIEILVADTGVGMTAKKIKQLFNPTDIAVTTIGTNNEKGSGLGLMLVKEFVDQLNGTIKVDSEIGKGTTICITINCS